ncbi:class I SAM-dependent methyltransferase [Candidatus Doolittlea endobia]|uniref:Ubiquinone/menaquinone biosynthesis C-methyltransferase UbiE n=1 Tax=Candidatus Doolittlea endobia TaxID=1778262 RepID=A0A143WRP2_9ENTR|nr:class I SAM-dependent methyltransferase [Candidatus Doolittlea endobia]CUX96402.1 Ubiquinone/menaquinone biosynthesis C-methyltransferase UbiE [Candidatus Doolittlea endobia]
MKSARSNKTIEAPVSWNEIPYGAYYRQALERGLKFWWPKLFGCHLLKIGALSADLDTGACAIAHQVNIGLKGQCLQVISDPYQLPFANKSVDACLLAHTLSYIGNPHRLLREVDRVLIDDGWLIITTFNPVSVLGLSKICQVFFLRQSYRRRMYTHTRLLDWLSVLNFEVLQCTHLQALPWQHQGWGRLLDSYCQVIGCLILIVARKRTFPINLMPLKNPTFLRGLHRPINTVTCTFRFFV